MSVVSQAVAVLETLAAAGAVISLWRGAARQNGAFRHAYRWFAGAAGLWGASALMAQALSASAGVTTAPLSIADLPALLALPAVAMGLVAMTASGDDAPTRLPWRGPGQVVAWLADSYVATSALFLIGWILIFSATFAKAGTGPGTFAVQMARPLADLLLVGACLPLVVAAGRRSVLPYLATAAMTMGDSLAVTARIVADLPGPGAVASMLAGFGFLAWAPSGGGLDRRLAGALDTVLALLLKTVGREGGQQGAARASAESVAAEAPGAEGRVDAVLAGPSPAVAGEPVLDLPYLGSEAGAPPDGSREASERDAAEQRAPAAQPATMAVAASAAGLAGVALIVWGIAGEPLARPVVSLVAGTMVLTLAARILGLVGREYSARRSWRDSRRQFRQLADRTSDAVLLADLNGVIRFASRAVTDYGYSPEDLRGTPLAGLVHPEDRADGVRAVRRAAADLSGRSGRFPCRVRAADGTWRHVEGTFSRYREGSRDDLLITVRDVSDQVALRRQVTHLVFHDGLTGLPNRAYVEQRARAALTQPDLPAGQKGDAASPAPVAGVIFLDMDGFTAVNDEVGHSAGDLLLAQVAHRIRATVPPRDTVARWGGDEFAVLIEGAVSAEEIVDIAERLARSVSGTAFQVGDRDVTLTASLGVALSADRPAGYVWRNADVAMTRAKLLGGGRVAVFGAAGEAGDTHGRDSVPESETKLLSG